MAKNIRIIPRLDIKGPNVVKGIQMEGLRVVGRPELLAPHYYEDGADELIYIDSVASLYGRNNLEEIIQRASEKIFIPLTVGGGIRTVDDIRNLLRVGADKIAINTAAIKNPQLIKDGANAFGSQCIVLSVQARKFPDSNKFECLTDNAREVTGIEVIEWIKKAVDLGAGEILLTSIDKDGTGKGFEMELSQEVSETVNVPVIISGGAGCKEDIKDLVNKANPDAICIGSSLHYGVLAVMGKTGNYLEEGNISFLNKNLTSASHEKKGVQPFSIGDLKQYLISMNIACCVHKNFK
jgi:imidazole glycerol-phosphate synthase subunit HisF